MRNPVQDIKRTGPGRDTPPPIHRKLIDVTLAEIRRLLNFVTLATHIDDPIAHALRWSAWRRRHQTEARRAHFSRRLRLQT